MRPTTFTWDILVNCGDPSVAEVGATFNPATTQGRLVRHARQLRRRQPGPPVGRHRRQQLQGHRTHRRRLGDGDRGRRRAAPPSCSSACPVGAEMCGPCFTPDDKTLFVAVQHPGDRRPKDWPKFGASSSFEDPATRWPDFKDGMPPRPSVVVITKEDGGVIGA